MANIEELYAALQAADAAGNTEDAKQLAGYIRQIGSLPKNEEKKTTIGGNLKEAVKGVIPGGIGLLETAGVGASALLPDEYETKTREFIKGAAAAGKKPFEAAPGYQESVGRRIGEGLGSMLPVAPLGFLGAPGALAGIGLGVASGAGEARARAEQEGATAEQRSKATAAGTVPGGFDTAIDMALASLPGGVGKSLGMVRRALMTAGVEGATEAAQAIAQNAIAKGLYKPNQSLLEGSGEEGAYGAGVGAIASVLLDMAIPGRSRGANVPMQPAAQSEEAPVQTPLSLGMTQPFTPVSLPDGSVAMTQADLDAFEKAQFENKYAPQPADEKPTLALGMTQPFSPVSLPDGSVALTKADLDAYEEEQFQKKYAAQPNLNTVQPAATPPQLGYSPLPGVPKIAADGTVLLNEEQEFQARVAPQKTRITTEAWQAMSPEDQANAVREAQINAELQSPVPGEGVSPDAGLTPAEARAQKRQIEKANAQNKAAPAYREEINQLAKDRAAAQKAFDEASKNKGNLFNELKGKIKVQPGAFGLSDINMDESLAKQLVNKEGKGALLEDMVADGLLDEYLTTPHSSPSFDAQAAVQEIADKLANKDYRSTIASAEMRQAQEERDRLDRELDDLKSMPDANVALGQLAEEQAGIEGLPTDALVDYAQKLGIDTEGIAQDVSRQTENMTAEQYLGAVRNAIVSEVNSKTGMETLASAEKGGAVTNATKEELQMEKDLEGKTLIQAAQYAVDKAPDNFRKFVAQKILGVLKSMEAAGVKFTFDVQGGNRRSSDLYEAKGLATFIYGQQGNPTSVVVLLNGTPVLKNQNGYPSGMNYTTLLHELLHVATRMKVNFLEKTSPEVKALNDLYKTVVYEFNKQARRGMLPPVLEKYHKRMNNALENSDELMTWGMTDIDMQSWLSQIKVGEKTLMDKLVELARKVLGISKPFETAFDRLVRTTDSILDIDVQTLDNGMRSYKYSLGPAKPKEKVAPQQQSLFSKRAQELFGEKAGVETTKLGFGKKEKAPTPTSAGKEALRILDEIGRGEQPADPTYSARIEAGWNNAVDNPKATIEHFKKLGSRKISEFKTKTFSSDAALQDAYEEAIGKSYNNQDEVIGLLIQASTSQANHADGVAGVALEMGTVEFDEENQKWKGKETADRFTVLSDVLQEIAQKYGYTQEQMNRIYHTALETRQTEQMAEEDKIVHLSDAQLAAGREFFRINPELNDAVKVWNGIRKNIMKVMVEGGMYSEADAKFLLSNTAYVPMYREMDPESAGGPVDSMRGLRAAADKARKGSMRTVNDIFDNQVRWVEFAVSRAVKAHKARTLADAAAKEGLAEKFDSKVVPPSTMPNVVKIWRDGKEEHFSMADPLFMDAFMGLQSVSIPMFKIAAKFANFLRQSIVMYPLFSAAQVTQDSVAAIFTSGLKPQFALRIPAYAVKELIRTMQGKSKYHEELKKYAAVGVRDVNSTVVRMEAEERFGIKGPPSLKRSIMKKLNSFAMAADNSVRQATYQAAKEAGLGEREALEKSFEIFNVRRRGTSKALAFAGQVIPFFPAYLAAQNVAFRTLSGQGTSPSQRQEALKNLAATTASVMVLSMLYAMMNGDDEDYIKKPAVQRDRLLMIPGTGGLSVPLRADVFLFPKILAEHTYLMLTDKGYEDGRKFRDSMASALSSAMTSPTVVPQVVKPAAEVLLNYNFFQQRPLIGTFQQKLDTERQFTDSTSEFSKMLGQTGLIAPINADHLIRGMFGSFGGLALWMTNDLLAEANPSGQRSNVTMQDAIATMPGTSGFVSKSYESALKKDFYTLKEDVDRATNTLNELKKNAPQEIAGFLAKEENLARVGISKNVNAIGEKLSNIRASMKQIQNSGLSGAEKQERIQMLRNAEEQMLQSIDVKKLRELGKI